MAGLILPCDGTGELPATVPPATIQPSIKVRDGYMAERTAAGPVSVFDDDGHKLFSLPSTTPDHAVDGAIYAYEAGLTTGQNQGRRSARVDICRALGLEAANG